MDEAFGELRRNTIILGAVGAEILEPEMHQDGQKYDQSHELVNYCCPFWPPICKLWGTIDACPAYGLAPPIDYRPNYRPLTKPSKFPYITGED